MRLPPYQRHSETSYEAAVEALEMAESLRGEVFRYIRARGDHGVTDEELILHFGGATRANAVRPRRIELVRAGFVRDSGRTRKTTSGRRATVWVFRTISSVEDSPLWKAMVR